MLWVWKQFWWRLGSEEFVYLLIKAVSLLSQWICVDNLWSETLRTHISAFLYPKQTTKCTKSHMLNLQMTHDVCHWDLIPLTSRPQSLISIKQSRNWDIFSYGRKRGRFIITSLMNYSFRHSLSFYWQCTAQFHLWGPYLLHILQAVYPGRNLDQRTWSSHNCSLSRANDPLKYILQIEWIP